MIVQKANIQLNSSHQLLKQAEASERFRFWKNEPRPPENAKPNSQPADQVSLSHAAKGLKTETQTLDLSQSLDAKHAALFLIIKEMVKKMTGKDLEIFSPDQLNGKQTGNAEAVDAGEAQAQNVDITMTPPPSSQPSAGFGMVYEQRSSYLESETASFSAAGTIQTKDGKSIDFTVQLNMSRQYYEENNVTLTAGDPEQKVDPLVINFDGNAAELSQTHFEFDIDANGTVDQIAALRPGSGFLALDKNRDGVINNGSELFGPNSGSGFAELAQYDSDKNGFIDEGDPIYDRLRIWQRLDDGSQQLLALGDKNVGAIYLGHATTPFQLRTEDNKSLGEVADTGVYLSEDGRTGTVQEINLTV